MVNQKYLEFLAQMECVASPADKAAINDVRGMYTKLLGTDNKYVQFLNKMESAASTAADKKAINAVRGRYAMMEMATTARGIELAKTIAEDDEKNQAFRMRKAIIHESIARGNYDMIPAVRLMSKPQLESLSASILGKKSFFLEGTSEPRFKIEWHWGSYQPTEQNTYYRNKQMYRDLMRNDEYNALCKQLDTQSILSSAEQRAEISSALHKMESDWMAAHPDTDDNNVSFGRCSQSWAMSPSSHYRDYGATGSTGLRLMGADERSNRENGLTYRNNITQSDVDDIVANLRETLAEECGVPMDQISDTVTSETFNSSYRSDSAQLHIMYASHENNPRKTGMHGKGDVITMCAYTVTPTGQDTTEDDDSMF